MKTFIHAETQAYHQMLRRRSIHMQDLGLRKNELVIKLEHVRAKHRRHHVNCTRRSHLTYAAYKRVFHHRGNIRRMNPDSLEGTLNFWPLSPCRKGDNCYPMPDRLNYDGTEP